MSQTTAEADDAEPVTEADDADAGSDGDADPETEAEEPELEEDLFEEELRIDGICGVY